MVLLEPNANEPKLIQDWTAYNDSYIWDIMHSYYGNKGVMAFSKKSDSAVPHDINTNYQNALGIAQLVKANLVNYPADKKIKVLECGAGSGIFSLNFLTALKDLGIADRVSLVISEYTDVNLKEIESIGMLKDYKQGDDYHHAVVDILKPENSKYLDGSNFDFSEITAVIFNYVLDAIPLTVLRRSETAESGFNELHLKLEENPGQDSDIMKNTMYLSDLKKDYSFREYKLDEQTELEQKYFKFFSEYYGNQSYEAFIPFTYCATAACENLMSLMDDKGFIVNTDITPGKFGFCQIYGNALAHEIDNEFIASAMMKAGYRSKIIIDKMVSRMIITKDEHALKPVGEALDEHFLNNNMVYRYIDLRQALIQFKYKESMDMMKVLIEEFEKIAKNSPYIGIYWGNYYGSCGDVPNAIKWYKEAKKYDYLNNFDLDMIISNLEAKLK